MTQDQIDAAFNTLYTNFYYTKVSCWEDCLVYRNIPFGYNSVMRDEIQEVINQHKLPLYLEPASTNGVFDDKITVKVIDYEKQYNN